MQHRLAHLLVLCIALWTTSCGGGAEGSSTPTQSCASCATSGTAESAAGATEGSGTEGSGTAATGNADASGTGVAGGVGSGGTGIGTDGGVGSGGTGISADAVGIGGVDAFGSIYVNGIRHDISHATLTLSDITALQLGVTVQVSGTVDTSLSTGTASYVVSAADLRGAVTSLQAGSGTFVLMGTTVSTDDATVFAGGATSVATLAVGQILQVHGLPGAAGTLRATRVEKLGAASSTIVSGVLQNLRTSDQTFQIGALTVRYGSASLVAPLTTATLANGMLVRVRAAGEPSAGAVSATQIGNWYTLPTTMGRSGNLGGLVTDYASLASFRLLGVAVDASSARITGGLASSIGNGVKVEVSGAMENNTLKVTALKIRHIPGTGGPVAFSVSGAVGQFTSSASFRVQGQPIDASGAGVAFVNGTASNLANGKKVSVSGSQVVNGVLLAQQVTFN